MYAFVVHVWLAFYAAKMCSQISSDWIRYNNHIKISISDTRYIGLKIILALNLPKTVLLYVGLKLMCVSQGVFKNFENLFSIHNLRSGVRLTLSTIIIYTKTNQNFWVLQFLVRHIVVKMTMHIIHNRIGKVNWWITKSI